MECPNCGKDLEQTSGFCPGCGTRLTGEATESMPPPPPGVEVAPTTADARPAAPPPPPPSRTKPGTSGWAVASLVMGILGFTCPFLVGSILAIIFGFIGRREIRKSEGKKGGTGLANAGIVLGIVMLALATLLMAVVIPISYKAVGPTRTVSRTVEAGGAAAVDAYIDIHNGTLHVTGGAGSLMEGEFTYNVGAWRPVVSYSVNAGTGELNVRQPSTEWWRWWQWLHGKNTWDVKLGGGVPVNLRTSHSWGGMTLDLAGVNLSALDASSSAGDLTAGLSGLMPSLREVRVGQSAGKVSLSMNGDYPAMESLDVENTAGSVSVDLSGRWSRNLNGTVRNSAGAITVRLPRDVGVHVVATTSAGKVSTAGLDSRGGGVYVNSQYEKSPVTLKLNVRNSAGDIDLILD